MDLHVSPLQPSPAKSSQVQPSPAKSSQVQLSPAKSSQVQPNPTKPSHHGGARWGEVGQGETRRGQAGRCGVRWGHGGMRWGKAGGCGVSKGEKRLGERVCVWPPSVVGGRIGSTLCIWSLQELVQRRVLQTFLEGGYPYGSAVLLGFDQESFDFSTKIDSFKIPGNGTTEASGFPQVAGGDSTPNTIATGAVEVPFSG